MNWRRTWSVACAAIGLAALLPGPIDGDAHDQGQERVRNQATNTTPPADFNYIPKRVGRYTATDWAGVIDSTWGFGRPTAEKLQIFDTFWDTMDQEYPGFANLSLDWDSLRTIYRSEIEQGVSRGRFYGIISHLNTLLMEAHTALIDVDVYLSPFFPGVPLLCKGGWFNNNYFGAGVTPLPDSSAMVLRVAPDHPLGLEPADIILGYDGIPWKRLFPELLEAQLPITWYNGLGSSERSEAHVWLMSVGFNWHLFDTLDVIKYTSGDTVHLATGALIDHDMQLNSTEQMPVAGVPMPDTDNDHWVSWGIVDGTQIGYIYVWSWYGTDNADVDFRAAARALAYDYETTGLIIDFRTMYGGQLSTADGGYSILFSSDLEVAGHAERSDPTNRLALSAIQSGECSHKSFTLKPNRDLYDRPIAVLTGPGARSAADFNAVRIRYHPMVRTFGKPTNGSATCGITGWVSLPSMPEWELKYTTTNTYLLEDPGRYLVHDPLDVDEEIWLTQEDVARGEDTVVKRAIEWIQNLVHGHDVTTDVAYYRPGIDTVTITIQVTNPNGHNVLALAHLMSTDSSAVDSVSLYDDGGHNDGAAGDGLWGGEWATTPQEKVFMVGAETTDSANGEARFLPNAARFTTIGPVVYDSYTLTGTDTIPNPGDRTYFYLALANQSVAATATSIRAVVTSLDTCSTVTRSSAIYSDIAAGESIKGFGNNYYAIMINSNCAGDHPLEFALSIQSDSYTFWSDSFSVQSYPVGIAEDEGALPARFALHQNYPNPFNPVSTIRYDLPQTGEVSLVVYDLLGREVTRLVDGHMEPGHHEVQWDGREFASGIYIARLVTPEYSQSIKMLLLK